MSKIVEVNEVKMRYSHQRERIYEYLMNTKEHPTAEKIYQDLREEMPNLSLGTVYRNLKVLQNLGKINTIPTVDGIERYDADCSNHVHFVCSTCGKIYDIMNVDYDKLINSLDLEEGFVPEKLELKLVGKCHKCKN